MVLRAMESKHPMMGAMLAAVKWYVIVTTRTPQSIKRTDHKAMIRLRYCNLSLIGGQVIKSSRFVSTSEAQLSMTVR